MARTTQAGRTSALWRRLGPVALVATVAIGAAACGSSGSSSGSSGGSSGHQGTNTSVAPKSGGAGF